jgi:uncharacterized protein YciI
MIKLFTIVLIAIAGFNGASAQSPELSGEMKTYYMVFLKKGPNRTQDSLTAAMIQDGHMAHLVKMGNEGKLCMAGPFGDDGDIRGICVYNVNSEAEARQLASDDPAVKSGRLILEIHPWYAMKGSSLK